MGCGERFRRETRLEIGDSARNGADVWAYWFIGTETLIGRKPLQSLRSLIVVTWLSVFPTAFYRWGLLHLIDLGQPL